LVASSSQLDLHAVNAVDTVDEEDENEDEDDLRKLDLICCRIDSDVVSLTFNQYCIFATIGLSERKVKRLRFHLKGIGTIKLMKRVISKTRRMKTYRHDNVSKCFLLI